MVELLKSYELSVVKSAREAREAIAKEPPDLILLDIGMPDVSGFDFFTELKSDCKTKEIPVIFLAASDSNKEIHRAIEIGGADYITKPYRAEIVSLRIKTQLELVLLRKKLKMSQLLDDLSGTKKKEIFNAEAKRWFNYARTEERNVSLCAVSIDNLKVINIEYDPATADEIIKAVARLLASAQKKNMIIARFGGGLFLLMAYGVSAAQFSPSLETLKTAIEKITFDALPDLRIKVSTGITDSIESSDYVTLLNNALKHNSEH